MHIETTSIDELLIVHLDVHADNRGWFKENWQREKMIAAGLPDFQPVQNNISYNADKGATRGLHAEPWDKFVSVAHGRVFGAWCDLREGSATYGQTVTQEIGPEVAVFVPRGIANGFQALEDNTSYTYLVNAHWSADATYTMVNLNTIAWPLVPTEISEKDRNHPQLDDATPMPARRILVTGANGQLGRALRPLLPNADFCDRKEFDITNPPENPPRGAWSDYSAIINCAAFNDVNGAESERAACWRTNALAPAKLAAISTAHNLKFVHVSTDYVFDGSESIHSEDEVPSPLSLYGASKAAGEAAAVVAPKHYVVRTSWVFGDGGNFVATMADLARRGIAPKVINDQRGRPTSADDLAAGIVHLLLNDAPYGIYHLSNSGDVATRAEIAKAAFQAIGANPANVEPVSTAEFSAAFGAEPATRPLESTFDLSKIQAAGFFPRDWRVALDDYLK